MAAKSPYPPELRRRAVRMVGEVRPQYPTEWAAITAVAEKLKSQESAKIMTSIQAI
jgi:transposase